MFISFWSLDELGLKDNGPQINKGYRYVLVVTDKFNKIGFTVGSKDKNGQTTNDPFENTLISSKRKPNLF